ncbi:MAG: hypothetical protein C0614_06170 [Desulfuromonas sp.]|nr:MAG: hypothetical protein C0614_06170 [Desulfuromonas sp.]
MNRKRLTLAVLLGILAVCLVYAYLATPRQQKAPPRAAVAVRTKSNVERPQTRSPQRVRLDLLQTQETPFPGADRDIFRFREQPVRVVRTVVKATEPEPEPVPVVVEQPQPVMPSPIEVVQKELSRFTFLGFMAKQGERTVFLSSAGELFVVKTGERFGKEMEFLVTGIEAQLLTVRREGSTQDLRIPLIENENLKPAVSAPARRESIDLPDLPQVAEPAPELQEILEQTREGKMPFTTPAENGKPNPFIPGEQ